MIKKILGALVCGFIASILLLQQDHAVHSAVGSYCTDLFRTALDCNFAMKVKSINLLRGIITFEDVNAADAHGHEWRWHADELLLSFSFNELVPHGKLVAQMDFNNVTGETAIHNGTFGIVPHIVKAMYGISPDVPLLLRKMTFSQARLCGKDPIYNIDVGVNWDCALQFTDTACLAEFNCRDGNLAIGNRDSLQMVGGVINLEIPYYQGEWSIVAVLQSHVPQLPQQGINCCCSGSIKGGIGSFTVTGSDERLPATTLSLDLKTKSEFSAAVTVPFNLLAAIVLRRQPNEHIHGDSVFSFTYNFVREPYFSGKLTASNISYNNYHCVSRAELSFEQYINEWRGSVSYQYSDSLGVRGDWHWAHDGSASLQLSNHVPLAHAVIEPWEVAAGDLSLSCHIDQQLKVKATYKGAAKNKKTDQKTTLAGTIAVDEHEAALHGTIDDQKYDIVLWLSPTIGIKEFNYSGPHALPISVKGKAYDHRLFAGSLHLPSVIEIINRTTGYKLDGEGKINLYGIIDYPRLALKVKFSQGAIRLPAIYNCINELEAAGSVDTSRQLKLNSLTCKLYEGTIRCTKAYASFDEQWQPTFIYLPLTADHCLLNQKKDLFASLSGDLLFCKSGAQAPHLSGNLVVNRSHLADALFAAPLRELFAHGMPNAVAGFWADTQCNLCVRTEHPIRIKTSFFDTQAQADLKMSGRLFAPRIAGTVKLDGGSLLFPYRPLHITKGIVTINEQQLDDPFIELVAKNNVKKYSVALNVQGSLNHNEINFSSNPPLKDEQIIGLLFAGSEEESLKSIAPALVMSNIKTLLFGDYSNATVNRYLKPAIESFKYVHFIPSFIDQAGRGGMRGTLEIDINDRWRAMIQKNFNLSEDTHVELEYLLSDEMSVKGIRDEHRDISSEVEMRFKF